MDGRLEAQLLDGEEYAARREELGKAALAGELTLAVVEEAMAYAFKPEGKKAQLVNLGFDCFLRYFESVVPVAQSGVLYSFLCRVRMHEGVGSEVLHYKILRHLSRRERRSLFIEGVLRYGTIPSKSLADWAHIAKIGGEEFSDWIVGLAEAYDNNEQWLSSEHPLVMILKHGAGQNFGSDITPWWESMPPSRVRKAIRLIADKRPDVLFASRKVLADKSRDIALRYLAPANMAAIALSAARQMPSLARVNAGTLLGLLPVSDTVDMFDRLSTSGLPGFVLCEALRQAMVRGEARHAMAIAQHFPEAIISSDLTIATELYRSSYGFGPKWGQLGEVVRQGLMQTFERHWVTGSLCDDGRQGLFIAHEGHMYFPAKVDADMKPGEVVLFKPATPDEMPYTVHKVSMHRIGPEMA